MNTPDWSKAPEGATHWAIAHCVQFQYDWYKHSGDTWYHYREECNEWVPTNTVGIALNFIKKQWRGPQDGLPPVGTLCCYQSGVELLDVQVVAIVTCGAGDPECIVQGKDDWWIASLSELRHAKSDRDRAIEEMGAAVERDHRYAAWYKNIDQSCAIRFAIEALYDAGYRKP